MSSVVLKTSKGRRDANYTQPSEPILFPKLRIYFADFPYLHSSSTRGCSPWRPDAVMSTSGFDLYRGSPNFSRAVESAPDTARLCSALPAIGPYLRLNRFQGAKTVKKKRELFPGLPPASPGSFALPPAATSQYGNFNPFPFRWTVSIKTLHTELPHLLGSTNPCPIAVHMEPFSTSVFKVLI